MRLLDVAAVRVELPLRLLVEEPASQPAPPIGVRGVGQQHADREERERLGEQVVVVDRDARVIEVLLDMPRAGDEGVGDIAFGRAARARSQQEDVEREQPGEEAQPDFLS